MLFTWVFWIIVSNLLLCRFCISTPQRVIGSLPQTDIRENSNITKSGRNLCGCPIRCGLVTRGSRILSGWETEVAEFPSLAYLTYKKKPYCGATLISSSHLITAAHCIYRPSPPFVLVHLGKYQRSKDLKNAVQVVKPKRFHPHPAFSEKTFNHDVGIIELEHPVKFTVYVSPACLPLNDQVTDGKHGTIVGWGRTAEKGLSSDIPMAAKVPVISNAKCKASMRYKPAEIYPNMFCAGYHKGKIDACQGDSGGPFYDIENSKYVIKGIISWGLGCGRAGYPGVYTRVHRYMTFIKNIIPRQCICT